MTNPMMPISRMPAPATLEMVKNSSLLGLRVSFNILMYCLKLLAMPSIDNPLAFAFSATLNLRPLNEYKEKTLQLSMFMLIKFSGIELMK